MDQCKRCGAIGNWWGGVCHRCSEEVEALKRQDQTLQSHHQEQSLADDTQIEKLANIELALNNVSTAVSQILHYLEHDGSVENLLAEIRDQLEIANSESINEPGTETSMQPIMEEIRDGILDLNRQSKILCQLIVEQTAVLMRTQG